MDEKRLASGGVPIYGPIKQWPAEPGTGGSQCAWPQSGEPWAPARLCRCPENSDPPTPSAGAASHHSTPTLVLLLCKLGRHPQKASGSFHVPYSSLFSGGGDLISEPPTPPCGPTCFPEDGEGCGVPGDVSGRDGHAERHCGLEGAVPTTPPVLPFSLHNIGRALTPYLRSPGSSCFLPEGKVFTGCRKPDSKHGQGRGVVIMRPTFLRGFV